MVTSPIPRLIKKRRPTGKEGSGSSFPWGGSRLLQGGREGGGVSFSLRKKVGGGGGSHYSQRRWWWGVKDLDFSGGKRGKGLSFFLGKG